MKRHKSVETRYYEEREAVFRGLEQLDRRGFLKASAAAFGACAGAGILAPGSFANIRVAHAAGDPGFRFAYISDSHLYVTEKNDRFARALMRAVEDINRLDPPPDFVLYGGDLAQLGRPEELDTGAKILKDLKVPVKMMVGEHDWYYDMGEKWKALFKEPTYSFEHKGVHFVVLNSVIEEDFWTARGLSPAERMGTVAGLDNGAQNPFTVGDEQIAWLKKDLAGVPKDTPLIVFSHSPLYKLYKKWNFWTDDAEKVQDVLKPFKKVTVIHGHTHQLLTHRIGNIHFHGMLSTAWPWP
jgi:3',5'-cyclic AMP phosphodiesterase CpdA